MVSREQKRGVLHEKLQILRSVTHSHAGDKMSIIADASSYIKDLQQKIAKLNQETASAQYANVCQPLVSVGVLDKGFLISVFMDKSCPPGLLASILEAFDEIGLTVLEARATCAGSFRLEAVGEEEDEGLIDAHAVEQAVVQAIKNCPTN
ncbi:transcription factor bHLH61-like [Miscanthus floridulus]|uniref:transcription factor bHLH61-like n=1 Tax=Miscanthus floridulus TaxID=154761 RepID=UPI003458A106